MTESDSRTVARQHTAQLLKMLRGCGSTPTPAPTIESKPTQVAEAPTSYARLAEPMPQPPAASNATPPAASQPSPRRSSAPTALPTVGDYLRRQGQDSVLGRLMAGAAQLNRLNQIFRAYLPPHLHGHAILVRLDEEAWLVQTDSPSWATRLRYALHDIRQALGQHLGLTLPKPHIQVRPAALPPPSRRRRLTLTEQNVKVLESAARTVPDSRLRAALLQLIVHGRQRDDST
ncbi:MAG: DciA family protein [Candidatus Competibacteraceae bacterium]